MDVANTHYLWTIFSEMFIQLSYVSIAIATPKYLEVVDAF
jgi:hypothetical protein